MRAIRSTPRILPSWIALAPFLLASAAFGQSKPTPHISCKLTHSPVVVYDHKTNPPTIHEDDDWTADCTIELDGKIIFAAPLPLVHPAKIDEVMGAFEEFRKKKAGEIVAKYEGKK